MKWYKTAGTVLLALMLVGIAAAGQLDYVDGVLLVRFYDDVNPIIDETGFVKVDIPEVDRLLKRFRAHDFEPFFGTMILKRSEYRYLTRNDYKLYFPLDIDMYLVAAEFAQIKGIEWAMPDILLPMDYIPNDPSFHTQWFHDAIQSQEAWDLVRGEEEIIVAAIDSGIDWRHPDLYDNIWINPGEDLDDNHDPNDPIFPEIPGTLGDWNYVDDDDNGFVDDFIGWDFVATRQEDMEPGEDGRPTDNDPMDFGGHGTGCNSAIAEVGDNGIGGAGVAFNCKIMGLRAGYEPEGDPIGVVVTSYAVSALAYAVENGAKVISLSYGGPDAYQPMRDAQNNAWDAGLLMFGAAGNDDDDILQYPAGYEHIIAVAATTRNGNRADFSNYGNWVDIAAPGVDCYTPWYFHDRQNPSGYDTWMGTSVATPIAAGVGALIINAYPDEDNEFWRMAVETAVSDFPNQPDHPIGSGIVNSYLAVTMFNGPHLSIDSILVSDPDGNGHPDLGETIEVRLSVSNAAGFMEAQNVIANIEFDVEGIVLVEESVLLCGFLAGGENADNFDEADQPLLFHVPNNFPGGIFANLRVFLTAEPNANEIGTTLRLLIGTPQILLVDDDGGTNYQTWIMSDLDELNYVYNHHDVAELGEPNVADLLPYTNVIWITGDVNNPLSPAEITALSGAMDNGVNLFLFGQTLDEQLTGTDFYRDYLHAQHVDLNGIIGLDPAVNAPVPPVIPNSRIVLIGLNGAGNNNDPDVIAPVGGAQAAYRYANTANIGGIVYEDDNRKLVYFAFAFEAVSGQAGTNTRVSLLGGNEAQNIDGILDWFGFAPPDTTQTLTIPLQGRYFELISSCLVPTELNASLVFGNIADLEIVYQVDGRIYIPLIINTIGNIDVTQGYQIFCRNESELTIAGTPIDPVTVYSLATHTWNWLGYPFSTPTPITAALVDITEEIEIVMTDDGRLWIPPIINTIGNMQSGEGYFVFVNTAVTFTYNTAAMMTAMDSTTNEHE